MANKKEVKQNIISAFDSATSNLKTKAIHNMMKKAYAQKGYSEGANDNNKFGQWYGMNNQPWCAIFVCWVAYQGFGDKWEEYVYRTAVADIPELTVKHRGGRWIKNPNGKIVDKPQPGDIFACSNYSHTGMVYSVSSDGKSFWSIEGNYGDKVASVKRTVNEVLCIARPKWGTAGNISSSEDSSGPGVDLSQTIKTLISSDNFKYINKNSTSNTDKKIDSLISSIITSLKTSMNDLEVSIGEDSVSKFIYSATEGIIKNTSKTLNEVKIEGAKTTTNLLSYPTLVEAPIIEVDFNGVTIGGYGNSGDKYPNYFKSMTIKKINGRINEYNINLVYQVRPGEDPNAIDKLLSRTGYMNTLKIKYGDSNMPGMLFNEQEAIITDVTFNEDVTSSTISYNIKALSSISMLEANNFNFKNKYNTKPSNAILDLLYNSSASSILLDVFPGMRNRTYVESANLVPTNDVPVNIAGMHDVSPLTYLSYLVSCMTNTTSSYFLTFEDGTHSNDDGTYFKISEVDKKSYAPNSNISGTVYEVDIGYPTNNFVTSFELINDVYFPLVYDYNGTFAQYHYDIDNNGRTISYKSNPLETANNYQSQNVCSTNWWTHVTEYPVSAKLTLKGLLKPVMLVSNIKINSQFYGQKDMASGMYVVTEQVDNISSQGYTTTLTLLRTSY